MKVPGNIELIIDLYFVARYIVWDAGINKDYIVKIKKELAKKMKIPPFSQARFYHILCNENLWDYPAKTIELSCKAISILDSLADEQAKSESIYIGLNDLILGYLFQGKAKEALYYCKKIKADIKKINIIACEAQFDAMYAYVSMYLGNIDEAKDYIDSACKKMAPLNYRSNRFEQIMKAEILTRRGCHIESSKLVSKEYETLVQRFKIIPCFKIFWLELIMGSNDLKKGDFEKAEKNLIQLITKSEECFGTYNKIYLQGWAHQLLGEIYENKGNLSKSLDEYLLANKIYRTVFAVKEFDDLSALYTKISSLALNLNRFADAKTYFRFQYQNFGVNHPRTRQLIQLFQKNGYPIPE